MLHRTNPLGSTKNLHSCTIRGMNFGRILIRLRMYAYSLWKLFWDRETPRGSKILIALALVYLLIPFDFVPDFIPFAGLVDDAIIVPLLIQTATFFIPQNVKDKYQQKKAS